METPGEPRRPPIASWEPRPLLSSTPFQRSSEERRSFRTIGRTVMDLLADRGRRVSLEELNTGRLLAHARKQAMQRNLDDILVVDVDGHHYENECFDEFLPLIENEVLRHLILAGRAKGRQTLMPSQVSFQDMGGRITRYPMRSSEKTGPDKIREREIGHRWMDAMSIDYSSMFKSERL